jgi:CRP-like cAMP-binding protein
VIDSGKFNVYKRDSPDQVTEENDGLGRQVFQYETGGSFGELALMYNCPRAATVRASTAGVLWRVDRETFRHIIIDSTAEKRKRYEDFLETVPLLSNLSRQERAQVADCLETVHFNSGDMIIRQGDTGDKLYLILDGKAKATQTPSGAAEAVEVGQMKAGQYFGERSLITREPRAANVIAVTPMTCACMDRSGFERLLGPLKDIMKKHAASYQKAEDILAKQKSPTAAAGAAGAGAATGSAQ